MKTNFNRVLSMICILAMLLSCVPAIGVQAADELSIITAQFVPYDQEIRVLADIPDDYTAKVYVADSEVACESIVTSDGTLLTSTDYVPSVYGIVPVKLEATNGTETLSDTQNVRIVKAFSKAESLSEDFNNLEAMTMSDAADTTVVNAVKADNSMLSFSNMPHKSATDRYVDITDNYTVDGSSALTMRFESTVASGLPSVKLDPATDGTTGIIELSYDLMTNNTEIRQTINPVSRAWSSKYTFITNDGTTFASSFQAVDYSDHCFGSTSRKVEVNKWYNIRFLMNLNDLTFEYYVNNELMNYGTFTYQSDSYTPNYIYGIGSFDIAAGTQGTSGATAEKPAYVTFDNIKITHVDTGASPASLSYSLSGEETTTKISAAEIPFNAESIKLGLNNLITYSEGDITLEKADGTAVDASVTYCEGLPYASGKNRSGFIITPDNGLELGQDYKIVISSDVKFGSNTYAAPTEVYFKSIGLLTVLSPKNNSNVNAGEKVELKACTPDAIAVDLYINDMFISTLTPDKNSCVSYIYDTANSSLGTKNVRFVVLKEDNTIEELNTNFNVLKTSNHDIIPLETFESDVESTYFSVVKQTSADSAAMIQTELDGRKAAGFYFKANSSTNKKVIQVQKSVDELQTGRVVLEYDMYLDYNNRNAELSISFGNGGNYTYYPVDIAKQFTKGKINSQSVPYYGWHKVKFVMDTVDQSSQLYLDGDQIGETCYTIANTYCKSGAAQPTSMDGFKAFTISLWQAQSYTAGETYLGFAVDNWHVYKEMPLPTVSGVTAFDNSANSNVLEHGGLVSNDARSFKVDIPNSIYADNASLVQNFKVLADNEELTVENAVLSDGTLSFDVASLPENADLELIIGKDTVLYDGVTTIGSDIVFALKVADDTGLYAKRYISLTSGKAKAVFKTDSFDDKSVTLIIATYNDDVLTGVTTETVNAAEADITTLTLPTSDSTHAKAFIWGGMDTVFPVSAGEVKVSVN